MLLFAGGVLGEEEKLSIESSKEIRQINLTCICIKYFNYKIYQLNDCKMVTPESIILDLENNKIINGFFQADLLITDSTYQSTFKDKRFEEVIGRYLLLDRVSKVLTIRQTIISDSREKREEWESVSYQCKETEKI